MSESEVIALAGWLALLAIGLWLMFSPIRKTRSDEERIEPVVPDQILLSTVRRRPGRKKLQNDGALDSRVATSTSTQQAALHVPADAAVLSAEPRERGGEKSSVAATRESDSDRQRPERKEIARTQNVSKLVDAQSNHHGLRLAEVAKAESEPEKRPDGDGVAVSGGAGNSSAGDEPAPAAAKRNASPGMVLDPGAVADVIAQKTPLGSVVTGCELLSGFFLRKHVKSDAIANAVPSTENVEVREASYVSDYNFFLRKHVEPDEVANALPSTRNVEVRVTSYFSDYNLRYSVAVSDALKNVKTDMAQRFLETRRFLHDYVVSVFDEALVVTLSPYSARPEFLAITPVDSEYEEFFGSLLSSSRITELFVGASAEPDGELRLYRELDRVLEHFQTMKRG